MPILKSKVRLLPISAKEDIQVKKEEGSAHFNHSCFDFHSKVEVDTQDTSSYEQSPHTHTEDVPFQADSEFSELQLKIEAVHLKTEEEYVLSSSKSSSKPTTAKIIRNYSQALCSFVSSKLVVPYLQSFLQQQQCGAKVKIHLFQRFIQSRKKQAHTISGLRDLLLVRAEDSEKDVMYKKLFMRGCEVFIKYFSVNWIFSGKVKLIDEHLKFRYKMLRRIQNPEHFTYLRSRVSTNEQ